MSDPLNNSSSKTSLGNFGSETVSIDNFAVGGAELSRAQRLEEQKQKKLDRLSRLNQGASLDKSYSLLEDGTLESNSNKIYNDLGDQEAQDLFTYSVDTQELSPNEDGSLSFADGTKYNGNTRRLYMFGTKGDSDAVKLGITRGDIPDARIRFIDDDESSYGWKPGAKGVDINKKYLDVLLPENVATMVEGVMHGRTKSLEGRLLKDIYTRPIEDKFPSFDPLEELPVPENNQVDRTQPAIRQRPLGDLTSKALSSIAEKREWNPSDATNIVNFMDSVAEIESNNVVDRKQGDSEEGIGRGKYQFETSKGSGANKTAVNRLLRGLPKVGLSIEDIAEADRAVLESEDPDFSKLSEDAQDLAFLIDKAEAPDVDLTGIAKGDISSKDAWITTHWKGAEEDRASKSDMWDRRFGSTQTEAPLIAPEATLTDAKTSTEDPYLANIKATLDAYKDYQEPVTYGDLGSGASEYYKNKEALFGPEGEYNEENGKKLFTRYIRDMDKKGRSKDVVDVEYDRAERYKNYRRYTAERADIVDSTLNSLKGFGATFIAELIVNPLDAIGDLTGAYDLGTEEEKAEYLNEAFGYNPEAQAMAMEEIAKQWDIASNSELSGTERAAAAAKGIFEAFATPEMLGTSLGALLAWISPGKFFTMAGKGTGFAKTAKRIDNDVNAGKLSKNAGKAKKLKAFMSLDGAKSFLVNQSGFIAGALGNVNNQYEQFVQNNNGVELEGAEKAKWFAGRFAVQMVNQNLDKFTDVSIMKNPGLITSLVPAVKAMTDKEFGNVAKAMYKGSVKTAENMGKEAAQEYSQTMMELFNSRYGSAQFKDVEEFTAFISDERNTREAGIAALAGAGGSGQFELAGSIGPALGVVSKAGGALGKKIKQTKPAATTDATEEDTPLTEEEVVTATAEADKSANAVIKKYASMFSEDEVAKVQEVSSATDQDLVETPSLDTALESSEGSYADIIAEIEAAEVVIEERSKTDRKTSVDDAALNLLRKAKGQAAKKVLESKKGIVLGSGYSPEDIVDDFLVSKTSEDGTLNVSEEEKTLVKDYLKANGQKPFRFKMITAKLDGKDPVAVYEESMGSGKNSAPSRRARLRKLVNTPGVSKALVSKEIAGIRNFLETQETRKTAYERVAKEVQTNLDSYNKNIKNKKSNIVAPKDVKVEELGGNARIMVAKKADGTYQIAEASKAIIDSIDDTIDHLNTTLSRYKKATVKVLGEPDTEVSTSGLAVPATSKTSLQGPRETDKEYYEANKPTKAIVDEKTSSAKWKKKGDYADLNESKISTGKTKFTSDDVVLLTTTDIKGSTTASKALSNAIRAGATVILEPGVVKNNKDKLKVKNLAGRYGGSYVNRDGKQVIISKELAGPVIVANRKAAVEKRRKDKAEANLLEAFDTSFTAAAEKRSLTKEEKEKRAIAIEYAKQYFPGDNSLSNMKKAAESRFAKEAASLTATLRNIMLKEGIDSKAYAEALGKASRTAARVADKEVKREQDRLNKTGKLVNEWKEAEAEAKAGGKPLATWIKEVFGEEGSAVAKNMLSNSIGKAQESERVVYVFYTEGSTTPSITSYFKDVENLSVDGTYQQIEVNPEKYVAVSEPTLLNTLNINEIRLEGDASLLFNDFTESAVTSLKDVIEKVKINESTLPLALIDSPLASLIFDADNNINPNFAVATKVALYNFMKNNSYLMTKNIKSAKDIAEILGKHEAELSDEAIIAMQDKGLLLKTATDSVGKDIAKLMGLKAKDSADVDAQLFNALVAEMGQLALLLGVSSSEGLLEVSSMKSAQFAKEVLGKKSVDVTGAEADVNFINVKDEDKAEEAVFVYDVIANNLPNMDVRRKEPSFVPLNSKQKKKATSKIKKEKLGINIAATSKEAMEAMMDSEMEADMSLVRFATDQKNKLRIMKLLGYIELKDAEGNDTAEFLALSYKERMTQASKNRDIERNMANLEWLDSTVAPEETKKSMWFNYFFSKNGRFFIDSNTINPQNNKHLDRFFVQPKAHNNTYTRVGNKFKNNGKDVTDLVHYAIAQGFGFATDKESTKAINKFSNNILNRIRSVKTLEKYREEFLNTGKVEALGIGIEHLGHALQAFDFIEKSLVARKEGKSFDSAITAEFDAVTSGFALKLLQMPILGEQLYTWLAKVGVFFWIPSNITALTTSKVSMNDVLSDKNFKDSYQFLASSVKATSYKELQKNSGNNSLVGADDGYPKKLWEAVSAVLPNVVEGEQVTSELRSLFKPPFMTFNYASSIKSIRGRLKLTMQDEIASKIAAVDLNSVKEKEQPIVELLKTFSNSDDIKVLKALQNQVREKDLKFVKVDKGASLGSYLEVMIDASYGVQVENVLTDAFEPFVAAQDVVNGSFKAMFEVFIVSFEKKMEEARKNGPVSVEKEKEIYESLKDQWPAIRGPLSNLEEEFAEEGSIGVYSTESASPYGVFSGRKPATTKLTPKMQKDLGKLREGSSEFTKTLRTSHMVKALSAAISAGSVVPIHYVDGAVMASTIIAMGGDITSIHDAIMVNLMLIGKGQKAYNKATIDVSASYSFVNEIVNSLDRIIESTELFGDGELSAYQKKKITLSKDEVTNAASYIVNVRNSAASLADSINIGREKLFNDLKKGAKVMHMAGTADGVFTADESNVNYTPIDTYPQIKDNNIADDDIDDQAANVCLI